MPAKRAHQLNGKAPDASELLLIDLRAKYDALFHPFRDSGKCGRHAAGSIFLRRQNAAAEGIPLASGEADAAGRMAFSRQITQLVKAGVLKRNRPRTRTRGAGLTEEGFEIIGGYCDLSSVVLCFDRMREMVEIGQGDDAIDTGDERRPLIREIFVIGERNYRNDPTGDFNFRLSWLHKELAHGLAFGWVKGLSDIRRHACYQLTTLGLQMLDADHDKERQKLIDIVRPAPNEMASHRYWETYYREIDARVNWNDEAALHELGEIPLSCSLPTRGELRELREELAEKKRLNLCCPKCGLHSYDFVDGTSPREAQCNNCKTRFPAGEPLEATA